MLLLLLLMLLLRRVCVAGVDFSSHDMHSGGKRRKAFPLPPPIMGEMSTGA